MKCLETNKVCPSTNLKCKECELKDCKETLNMIDKQEQKYIEHKERLIRVQLPVICRQCSFLVITNMEKQKVYCPYRIKDKCLIK